MELIFYAITPAMLFGAWISGTLLERRHLKKLLLLESGSRDIVALTIEEMPSGWEVQASDLVLGNVVISQDYFKRVAASLKGVVGGRIGVYELLEIDYTLYTEEIFPSNGDAAIAEAAADAGNELQINEDVILQRLQGPIFDAVPGIATLAIRIATSATATVTDSASWASNSICMMCLDSICQIVGWGSTSRSR